MSPSVDPAREAAMLRDLSDPANLPGQPRHVDVVTTHGSLVFLTETEVFKVKRAVDFGFFDFTTLAARHADSEREITLNRRTAADVYLGVDPVFRDADGFSLTRGDRADAVLDDYAVRMRRLPEDRTALHLLEQGELGAAHLDALARYVTRFYGEQAERAPAPSELVDNFAENFAQIEPFAQRDATDIADDDDDDDAGLLTRANFTALCEAQRDWLTRHAELLATRKRRDGHGDLRLEHVYYLDDGPIAIDCIEFNERFRIADPALDVGFFAMELYREARADLAETLLGSFAYESDDYDWYPLADGYLSYRATVRAKVAGFVATDPATPRDRARQKRAAARRLFELAAHLLQPRREPRIVAVGGLPASGKSTVARALRPILCAPFVSADATRKHLAGIDKSARGDAAIYTPEFSARVFDEVIRRADRVLASGRSVIVDTTFHKQEAVHAIRALAERRAVRLDLLDCRAPVSVLRERIRARRGDVSDADEAVLDRFLDGPHRLPDAHPIDTTLSPTELAASLNAWSTS